MKKILLLIVSLLLSNSLLAHENSLLQARLHSVDRSLEGRSLKDILAQYGGQLKPGVSVITIDGVLEGDTPIAEAVVKLQRRVTEFKIVRDDRLLRLLPVFVSGIQIDSIDALIGYIRVAYEQERSPLVAFIADVIHEKQEAASLTTEALRLLSDCDCRAGVSEVMQRVGEYSQTLLVIEKTLEHLWQEIKHNDSNTQ